MDSLPAFNWTLAVTYSILQNQSIDAYNNIKRAGFFALGAKKRIQPHVIDEKALLVSISTESRCITEQVAKIQPMVAPAPQIEMSHPVEKLKLGSGWNERES